MNFCNKIIASKSQYAEIADHKCHCIKGHTGKCNEFPFLEHLKATAPSVCKQNQTRCYYDHWCSLEK